MTTTMYLSCSSDQLTSTTDENGATTQTCSAPQWVPQPSFIPFFDAAAGVALGVATLTCWATAYGFKSLRRVGD